MLSNMHTLAKLRQVIRNLSRELIICMPSADPHYYKGDLACCQPTLNIGMRIR